MKTVSADVTSTGYAEGKIFKFESEDSINPDFLERFNYQGPRQWIRYSMPEFSAVCPFSGLPDYGLIVVDYVPKDWLVELKALKYYYLSFRNVGIFQEAVTSRIFQDLNKLLQPEVLIVRSVYNTRGGIDTTCIIRSEDQESLREKTPPFHTSKENL
ncbi:MAG: NADPH-dependent 7-cyano-7-deazaguanine reductase QueF [SAR324 cluster bacterium]|nr:NADPH-dependent 7-cyano-7-deazaguanine reductase QueF [SAR324 cluster bacterium]